MSDHGVTRPRPRCSSVNGGERCELTADHTGPHLALQDHNQPRTWWLSDEPAGTRRAER